MVTREEKIKRRWGGRRGEEERRRRRGGEKREEGDKRRTDGWGEGEKEKSRRRGERREKEEEKRRKIERSSRERQEEEEEDRNGQDKNEEDGEVGVERKRKRKEVGVKEVGAESIAMRMEYIMNKIINKERDEGIEEGGEGKGKMISYLILSYLIYSPTQSNLI